MLTLFRPNVKKLEAEGNVEGLIRALQYSDINEPWSHQPREVRCLATEALGKIGDGRAAEPLIAALKDEDRDVRWSAAEALTTIDDVRAVEPLIAVLKDNKEFSMLQNRIIEALGKIGDGRAVEPIMIRVYVGLLLRHW